LLARAIDQFASADQPFNVAMMGYQHARDAAVLPMFELTCELATLEPPPPERAAFLAAVHGDKEAMDNFCSVIAGTLPVAEFFEDETRPLPVRRNVQHVHNPSP